ncbi:MAG: aldehyde-activating protein [Proteobacteria bacterium]|nr:aldehyde-activating protein [Pseudomonadota bacterium]
MADMREFDGGCHCGNVTLRFETAKAPADFSVRACGCSFCRRHQTRTVADPAGTLHIVARDPRRLSRYRFGLKTTDFLVCRACGVYLGAVYRDADGAWGLINTPVLAARAEFDQPATSTDHDAETEAARRARRKSTWTPASFDPPSLLD